SAKVSCWLIRLLILGSGYNTMISHLGLIRTFPNNLAGLQQDNNSGGLRNILKNKRIKKPRIGEAYV
ncbi:hypothetical protein KKZ84_08425, partial [Enterobacter hormaechei subsp. xiangfangensis]|nr:hypothetical protein [Enterobacter hormaechei subsp. xiangfangensis]